MATSGTPQPGTSFTGAQLIVHLLERQGITTVAGIPGGAALPLYDALSQSTRIHHVLARHEQGAGFMAQGMARANGKAAVCIASSGPGATNRSPPSPTPSSTPFRWCASPVRCPPQ